VRGNPLAHLFESRLPEGHTEAQVLESSLARPGIQLEPPEADHVAGADERIVFPCRAERPSVAREREEERGGLVLGPIARQLHGVAQGRGDACLV
jgi:hypothetical protein